jgi:RNA polymerase sigma factor (sigma-70 family)
MQDRDPVSAIVAGGQAGLAVVYDRYAPALYSYCRVLLAEPAGAAGALADTFIVAAARLGGLRDPGRLRPWLYAVARNECLRRLRRRAPAGALDPMGDWAADESDAYDDLELAHLRALVGYALTGLSWADREVLELSLRQGLDGDGLAAVLGVSPGHAQALATRAGARFERCLGTLLAAQTAQDSCWKLAALLDGWDGRPGELWRKRISRHTEHCPVCGDHRGPDLSPAMLLNLLPAVLLPPDLRDQILHLLVDDSPDAFARRSRAVRRARGFDRAGFPRAAGQRGVKDQVLGATAMLVFLALLGVGTVFALAALNHHAHPPVSALVIGPRPPVESSFPASPGHTATAPSPGISSPAASLTPTPTVSPSASATPSASASARPSPSASASPSPSQESPSPSASPLPSTTPPGTVVPAPTTVVLAQGADGSYSGSFTITASGGPVDFSVSNPAPGNLAVAPSAGSLAPGEQATVSVSVQSGSGLAFDTPLAIDPGGVAVDVQYPPAAATTGLAQALPHALAAGPGRW